MKPDVLHHLKERQQAAVLVVRGGRDGVGLQRKRGLVAAQKLGTSEGAYTAAMAITTVMTSARSRFIGEV
jgi:hypothetical protein